MRPRPETERPVPHATPETDPLYLGVDLGTSSLKLIAVESTGTVHARARIPYSTRSEDGGISEQDPAEWFASLRTGLAQFDVSVRRRVRGIGVDGHVPSVLIIGAAGNAKTPCLTWMDTRADEEASELAARFGDPVALVGAHVPWVGSQLPAKSLWLARNREIALDADRMISPKDYLNAVLTGTVATDRWSMKGLCDVRTGQPVSPVLSYGGWADHALPPTVDPWQPVGSLLPAVARTLGLQPGVTVAGGWTDAMAAVLAVGGFDSPSGVVLSGTTEIVGLTTLTEGSATGLYTVPRTVAPLPFVYGPTQAGGASLEWVANVIGQPIPDALELGSEAHGLTPTFVPFLNGERAPLWDTRLRGMFAGLSSSHSAGDLVRAVLSAVANSAREIVDLAAAATGAAVTEVNVGGIGATHPAWLQARARAFGVPLRIHTESHLTALGAAMLGALANGLPRAQLSRMRSETTTYQPSPADITDGAIILARHRRAVEMSIEWSRF